MNKHQMYLTSRPSTSTTVRDMMRLPVNSPTISVWEAVARMLTGVPVTRSRRWEGDELTLGAYKVTVTKASKRPNDSSRCDRIVENENEDESEL